MNKEIITIKIKRDLVEELQNLLDQEEIDFHEMKVAEDSTLETFTARFSNGFEADIKVCSGQHNCYIDPVLFNQNGYEIQVLDAEFDLLGGYIFEIDNKEYIVELVKE